MINLIVALAFMVVAGYFGIRALSDFGFKIASLYPPKIDRKDRIETDVADSPASAFMPRELRPLQSLETGVGIMRMPADTYGFVDAIDTASYLELKGKYTEPALSSKARNEYFEVQKIGSRLILVGYVGRESFARLSSNDQFGEGSFFLSSLASSVTSELIGLPLEGIIHSKFRWIEDSDDRFYGADFSSKEVVTDVKSYR